MRLLGRLPQEILPREYVWFVRDGRFIRSLTHVGGLAVSAEQQKASEELWIKEEKGRSKVKSVLEYFYLNDPLWGSAYALQEMKKGNYKFRGEIVLNQRRFILLRADYSWPLEVSYTLYILPKENRLVQVDINLGSRKYSTPMGQSINNASGKYSMLMGQPIDNIWLPVKCSGYLHMRFSGMNSPSFGFIPPYHCKSDMSEAIGGQSEVLVRGYRRPQQ